MGGVDFTTPNGRELAHHGKVYPDLEKNVDKILKRFGLSDDSCSPLWWVLSSIRASGRYNEKDGFKDWK